MRVTEHKLTDQSWFFTSSVDPIYFSPSAARKSRGAGFVLMEVTGVTLGFQYYNAGSLVVDAG